jgi:alcohol dehydrogenase class IV
MKKKKEELSEDMEIQKELENDDITPIQDKVSKLFDDVEVEENVSAEFPEDRIGEILESYTDGDCIPRSAFPDLITSILEELK